MQQSLGHYFMAKHYLLSHRRLLEQQSKNQTWEALLNMGALFIALELSRETGPMETEMIDR